LLEFRIFRLSQLTYSKASSARGGATIGDRATDCAGVASGQSYARTGSRQICQPIAGDDTLDNDRDQVPQKVC
jgi:hypothetical protein